MEQLEQKILYYCKRCGKPVYIKYGSGKFCGQSCANARDHSEDTKKKIAEGIRNSDKFRVYLDDCIAGKHINSKASLTGYYNGVFCGSTWELAYYIYCIEHNIKIERCRDRFPYEFNGEQHLYIPDWYLPETNTYIEIKGKNDIYYCEDNVLAKQKAMLDLNLKYELIYDVSKQINYCKKKFNTNKLETLYDDAVLIKKSIEKPNKKHCARTANYVWINNTNINTLVPSNKLAEYLINGWHKGKLASEKDKKAWERARKKISSLSKQSELIYNNQNRKGKQQLYKDNTRIFVLPEQVSEYLLDGWKPGTGHKQNSKHHSGGNYSHTNLNKKKVIIDGKIYFK